MFISIKSKSEMKINFLNFAILLIIIFSFSISAFAQKNKHRLIFNNDGTYVLGNDLHKHRPISIEDVYDYIDILTNTQVTTYMICHGSSLLYYKSNYDRTLGSARGDQKNDCEINPKFTEVMKMYDNNIKILADKGTDIIKLCIDRAKEKGLESFITMRMNDLHFTDTSLHCTRAQNDFWLDHPEYRVGDYPGWHAYGALNFAHKEVREYKLNLIREMCERYNIDGLDLDFMRFIIYFPYGEGKNYLDEMTDFMKKAREITNKIGKKRGRPILLSARVPSTISFCLDKGLDVKKWADMDLVDFITIGAHWTCDPTMPVREFKQELSRDNIPVYVSIDDGQYYLREFRSDGIYRAIASHYYSEGADGLYLFNYFFPANYGENNELLKPKEGQVVRAVHTTDFLKEIGDMKTLKGRNKIYTLSDGITEYGFKPNTPLPMLISPWDEEKIKLNISEDIQQDKPKNALLFFRITKGAIVKIFFNKKELVKADAHLIPKFGRDANLLKEEEVQVYSVPIELIKNGYNTIAFRSDEPVARILRRVEFAIEYEDVEKNGYF
jgi:hypothetical protein